MQFRIFQKEDIVQGISEVSFGSMRGKRREKRAREFLKSLDHRAEIRDLIWAEQVFGSKVHICGIKDSGKTIKGVDGLISNIKNQVLSIVTADCVPILIYVPKGKVVAALHGSRESLIKGIVRNAISKMVLNFNSNPKEILVGIGPHIRKCHYWLKDKTYQKLKKTKYKRYFINNEAKRGSLHRGQLFFNKNVVFDLTRLVFDELLKSGIEIRNIEDCGICTYCQAKKFFSVRKKEENPRFYKEKYLCFGSFIGLF